MINKISGTSTLEYYPKIASTPYAIGTVVYPDGLGHITTSTAFSRIPLGIVSEEIKATDSDYATERKIAVTQILPGDKFEADVSVNDVTTLSVVQPYLTNALIGNIYSINKLSTAVEIVSTTSNSLVKVVSLAGDKIIVTFVLETSLSLVNFSGRVIAAGDSYAAGVGVTTAATDRMTAKVASALGLTETNIAVGGTVMERIMDQQIASFEFRAGDVVPMMCGYNNVRYGGITEANITSYSHAALAVLGWMGVSDTKKVFSQIDSTTLNSAQVVFNGAWLPSTNGKGALAQSRAGAYTTTNGNYCETTVSGDTIYILVAGQTGFTSKVVVTVDGLRIGSTSGVLNITPPIAIPDGSGVPQPTLIRLSNLSTGQHTVRVTNASAAGQFTYVLGFAGFHKNATDFPIVLAAGPASMTATGYAIAPASGSTTAMRLYQDQTKRVVSALRQDGLYIRYVDLDLAIRISDDMIAGDDIHAEDMWHALAAKQFESAAVRPWQIRH